MALLRATMSYPLLAFEKSDDPEGEWMSMGLRMKLDLAGLRISLADWQALEPDDRAALNNAPAEAQAEVESFAALLKRAMQSVSRTCESITVERVGSAVNWKDSCDEPVEVTKMRTDAQSTPPWQGLDRFGRYVLYSLASRGRRKKFDWAARELAARERDGR
ncbi:MAG TPA: hypothetical protein EYG16_11535 [Deltaproteobacteria bacterium]|nr:hypothetical protein [Candidatus Binatota bacterium]HIL14290.1 hypothetical protein [Deltaproteobacteria bacterium]